MPDIELTKKIVKSIDGKGYRYYQDNKYTDPKKILCDRSGLNCSDIDKVDDAHKIEVDLKKGTVTLKIEK